MMPEDETSSVDLSNSETIKSDSGGSDEARTSGQTNITACESIHKQP